MTEKEAKLKSALIKPRITEKAAISADKSNVYVFDVIKGADKKMISDSIKQTYKVVPKKIHTVNLPSMQIIYRGRRGVTSGFKKAYVYLKKGDKIDII